MAGGGAGLLNNRRSQHLAQRRPCRIEATPLAEANAWLERYRQLWEQRFDALDTLLAEMKAAEKPARKNRPRRPS